MHLEANNIFEIFVKIDIYLTPQACLRPCVSSRISDYNYNTNTGQIRLRCLCQHEPHPSTRSSESQQFTKTTEERAAPCECGCHGAFYRYIRICKKCNYPGPVSPQEWDRRRNVCVYCDELTDIFMWVRGEAVTSCEHWTMSSQIVTQA